MATGSYGHGSKCVICGRFFTPDPRLGARQKCCGRPRCRQEYKNRWQKAKYDRDGKFRTAVKGRIRRWRWNRSHGRAGQEPGSGAGPPGTAALARVAGSVTVLEQTVAGLLSHGTGCRNAEELRPLLLRCAERGREVLGVRRCRDDKNRVLRDTIFSSKWEARTVMRHDDFASGRSRYGTRFQRGLSWL